jgi:hypothetical protein
MEARFIVVDEYRGGDMHGVDETKTFRHAASLNQFLNLRRDVDGICVDSVLRTKDVP